MLDFIFFAVKGRPGADGWQTTRNRTGCSRNDWNAPFLILLHSALQRISLSSPHTHFTLLAAARCPNTLPSSRNACPCRMPIPCPSPQLLPIFFLFPFVKSSAADVSRFERV